LCGKHLRSRSFGIKPLSAIYFRKCLAAAAPWRPFDLERVALKCGRIEIALACESDHALPARLPDLAERY